MPQFHETGYGKRFFDSQLPALIKNLGRIADALEQVTVVNHNQDQLVKDNIDKLLDELAQEGFDKD